MLILWLITHRVHLQSVHHAYARHLEAIGDLKGAMQHYMKSGTAANEVRMADMPAFWGCCLPCWCSLHALLKCLSPVRQASTCRAKRSMNQAALGSGAPRRMSQWQQ
jgi:hypothetical protein